MGDIITMATYSEKKKQVVGEHQSFVVATITKKHWSMTWLSHLLKHLFQLNQLFFQLWKQYWQFTILVPTMNIIPTTILPTINVWCIQPPKYHDNDDLMSHLQKLTKVCVTNKEDTNNHKLQYFLNSLKGWTTN